MVPQSTERLIIRPWRLDDLDDHFQVYGDAEVLKFLGAKGDPPTRDMIPDRLAKIIARHEEWNVKGLGFWAIEVKDTGRAIGTILLAEVGLSEGATVNPDGPEVEIGWHLAKPFWGKGYATEAGRAALDYAFRELGLREIIAVVFSENVASRRVAEKLGLQHQGLSDRYFGYTLELYRAENSL